MPARRLPSKTYSESPSELSRKSMTMVLYTLLVANAILEMSKQILTSLTTVWFELVREIIYIY